MGKRTPNTQGMYRIHPFCLLLVCWLVFHFLHYLGLQPPSKLVAVAVFAIRGAGTQIKRVWKLFQNLELWLQEDGTIPAAFLFSLISHHLILDVVLVAEVQGRANLLKQLHGWENKKWNHREPKITGEIKERGELKKATSQNFYEFLNSPPI